MPRNIKYSTSASEHQIYTKCLVISDIRQMHRKCQVSCVRWAGAEGVKCQGGRGGNKCVLTSNLVQVPPNIKYNTNASYHHIYYNCLVTSHILQTSRKIKCRTSALQHQMYYKCLLTSNIVHMPLHNIKYFTNAS